MIQVQSAKKSQAIASNVDYKHLLHSYFYPPDSINLASAKKSYTIQSDVSNFTSIHLLLNGALLSVYSSY